MKYLDKKFSTPANSKAFVDNWNAVFGEKPKQEDKPEQSEPVTADDTGAVTRSRTTRP